MALKITNIDIEIGQNESALAILEVKIEKASKTMRNYKKKRDRLLEKRNRLRAVKVQADKLNKLETI